MTNTQNVDEIIKKICNCQFNRSIHEKCNNYTYCGSHDFCLHCELTQKLNQVREGEREKCKQIYIDGCDWMEWGITDEEAGEKFEEDYKEFESLKEQGDSIE
jgi:hypothetical protein